MSDVTLPPYAQIVADLRDRIAAGEMAPGDRVPSTREITRRWGVAMATATKALNALRQEGLVHPIPGVGTVVGDRRPAGARHPALPVPAGAPLKRAARRRTTPHPVLGAERIVAAGIAVADAEGLAGLSMRRVATEIGVATMSLYRHVADKDDLLLQMMDAAFRECDFPAHSPNGWRARLEFAARTLWALFQRHSWLAPALSVSRPQAIPAGMACTEWVLAALDGYGLDLPTMLNTHITLFNYVRGTAVNLELEAEAEAVSGMNSEEWMDTQQSTLQSIVVAGQFPVLKRLIATEYDFDPDALFEFGLQRVLDGFAVLIGDGPGEGASST